MGFQQVKWFGSHLMHCPGTGDIKQKACPESNDMPGLKVSGNPFRPNSQ
jgi:hypothetical protein